MKKNMLITGSTSGIGLDVFKKNIEENFQFYLIGRNFSDVDKILKDKKYKLKTNKIKFDFKNKLNRSQINKLPKLDYIVLAAGIFKNNLVKNFNEKIFDQVININLLQTAKLLALLVKHDKINYGASIVIVSSISGHKMSFNYHYAYSISKAGITAIVKTLAIELSTKLIRINAVAPGMVSTSLAKTVSKDHYFTKIDKAKYLLGRRYAKVSEVSSVIKFLLSSESSFITGETIIVDGGFSSTR